MEEEVHVVNEQNEIIDICLKHEAHKKGLLHRTVSAEIIGSDGKWTLVRQSSDRQDAGQFVFPVGGHVQAGETEEDALKRETGEEYGLFMPYVFRKIGKKIFNRNVLGRKENHYLMMYQITTDQRPVLNKESIGYRRFSKKEIKKLLKEKPKLFGGAFHFAVDSFYPELLL